MQRDTAFTASQSDGAESPHIHTRLLLVATKAEPCEYKNASMF